MYFYWAINIGWNSHNQKSLFISREGNMWQVAPRSEQLKLDVTIAGILGPVVFKYITAQLPKHQPVVLK